MERKSYEIPADVEGMSPERAGQAINKLAADWTGDQDHPLNNSRHPQYKDFSVHREQLYKRKAEAPKPPPLDPTEMPGQVQRYEKAKGLMGQLANDHNYEKEEIKRDIPASELRAMQQHVYSAKGEFPILSAEFAVDLKDLGYPDNTTKMFNDFRASPSQHKADALIKHIISDKRKRGFIV